MDEMIADMGCGGMTHKTKKIIKGFTNGVYDLLHIGHIRSFQYARQHCDYLIVGINSDESAARLNKTVVNRPIIPARERKEILESINWVDEVIIFDEDTPEKLIKKLKPDVLFKGEEYKGKEGHPVGKEYVHKIIFTPNIKSTTEILKKILIEVK